MTKSQLQDLGIVNEQLGLATQETESLKLQIETNLRLATKMAEEIETLQRIKKRARIASYVEIGVGVPLILTSYIPGIEEEWKRTLFITGVSLTACGGVSFVITLPF